MTLEDLAKETLVEKNRRLRRAKCMHEEIHISSVTDGDQTFTNIFCLDCGLSLPRPSLSTPENPHAIR